MVHAGEWSSELSRRVQHYGWQYDYRARRVDESAYLGPLPGWLEVAAARVAEGLGVGRPNQVIVNEYLAGQGIAPHIDCITCFGPVVSTLSLGSEVQMDLSLGSAQVPVLLERGSLLALTGPARYVWQHGIAKRLVDKEFGVVRSRRVSLTFRTVEPV